MKKVIKAPAKINLCLRVNGKRNDGYHDLSMIMQAISLFDTLEFNIVRNNEYDFDFFKQFQSKLFDYNSKSQINIKSNYSYIPTDERNLIYRVLEYVFDKYNIKDKIFLYLNNMIPTSGGLGGGSSDAASMLLFLNRYYKLKLSTKELSDIAALFGSDIPFFIHRKECICEGRGEIITEIKSFNNYFILIATPNVRVSTKEIFSKIDSFNIPKSKKQLENIAFNNCLEAIRKKDLRLLSNNLFNNLELVTETMFSDVSLFKEKMVKMGALTSLMSGSGPTVFGIFNSYLKALNCKNMIKKEHNDAFVFLTRPI